MSDPTKEQHAAARMLLAVVFAKMSEAEDVLTTPGAFFDGWTDDGEMVMGHEVVDVADMAVAATTMLVRAYHHAESPLDVLLDDMNQLALQEVRVDE